MGGLCSKSNDAAVDLDRSRHVVATAATLNSSTTTKTKPFTITPATTKTTTTTTTTRASTVDDTEKFFDTFQSFSDLSNINYPPATKMMAIASSTTICIETAPDSLLSTKMNNSSPQPQPVPVPVPVPVLDSLLSQTSPQPVPQAPLQKQNSTIAITENLRGHTNITTHGYPGELDEDELNACLRFRDELKKRDPAYREMVLAYSPAESEAFALCRFLRARDFNVDEVLTMLEENGATEIWKEAKEQNFYRDNLKELYNGCPVSVLMTIFPIVVSGIAKNGAVMFYFKPSFGPGMDINGLECIIENLSDLIPYLWDLLHTRGIDSMIREQKCHNPETTTILSERIIVIDLKGMPSALYDKGFMSECNQITNCFPETMNRTYMINVPMAFSVVWSILKMFIEPRTIEKIGFFSYECYAKDDLLTFVDSNELLSTYGGDGPSFEDVLQTRQATYENNSTTRLIVETVTIFPRYESKFKFDLKSNEKVTSIHVYSKGDSGADFTVSGHKAVLVETTNISRKEGSEKMHYSVNLFNDDDSDIAVAGPGKFEIVATGSVKEYYLVTIHVASL